MWELIALGIQPFLPKLPIVLFAGGVGHVWGTWRAWKSYGRSRQNCGFFWRLYCSVMSGFTGAFGAAISAGLGVTFLTEPWTIVSVSSAVGVMVDVTASAGAKQILSATLRWNERTRRILKELDSSPSPPTKKPAVIWEAKQKTESASKPPNSPQHSGRLDRFRPQ